MAIYLKNATFIDWQTLEFKTSNIKVNSGINNGFEFINEIPINSNEEIIDCTGKYVTK
jgi:dihydroorotase-like cyclic amidohydrolase